jgi:hypothetical protein
MPVRGPGGDVTRDEKLIDELPMVYFCREVLDILNDKGFAVNSDKSEVVVIREVGKGLLFDSGDLFRLQKHVPILVIVTDDHTGKHLIKFPPDLETGQSLVIEMDLYSLGDKHMGMRHCGIAIATQKKEADNATTKKVTHLDEITVHRTLSPRS